MLAPAGQLLKTVGSMASQQGHGSRACYISGCREPACVRANAAYQRDYRHKLRGTYDNRMGPFVVEATRPKTADPEPG